MKITNRRKVIVNQPDTYFTPEWVSQALLHYEKFKGSILEPCCGAGNISAILKAHGYKVRSQDLYNYGYGKSNRDFLKQTKPYANIITNPPFNKSGPIIIHAQNLFTNKLCLLLRLQFLEGSARYHTIFKKFPPSRIRVFVERVTFYPANFKNKTGKKLAGGTICYCWAIWDKSATNKKPQISWIKPGFKKQYPPTPL